MANKLGSAYVDIGGNLAPLRADLAEVQSLMRKQLSIASLSFQKMGAGVSHVTHATHELKKGFWAAMKSALSLERVINRLAFILTVGAVFALMRAISETFRNSISYALEFEKQMANVYTMLDKTEKKFKDFLSVGVRSFAKEFGQSTETLAGGLYDILSASIPVSKSLYVLGESAKAATAGMTDTKTAADAITSVLNAYQMSATKAGDVSDWLFSIVKEGKLTFQDLAGNIGKVISSASLGGLSLEELGASIATMTRQGIKSREAMTALNRLILAFIKPQKNAIEVAKKYGLALNANTLKTLGLTGVINRLRYASKEELAIIGTTVRAFKALAAGVNDSTGQFVDLEEMVNRSGKTQDAFNEIAETTAFKISRAKETLKLWTKDLGDKFLPLMADAADALRKFFDIPLGTKEGVMKDIADKQKTINELLEMANVIADKGTKKQKDLSKMYLGRIDEAKSIKEVEKITLEALNDSYQIRQDDAHLTKAQLFNIQNIATLQKQLITLQSQLNLLLKEEGDEIEDIQKKLQDQIKSSIKIDVDFSINQDDFDNLKELAKAFTKEFKKKFKDVQDVIEETTDFMSSNFADSFEIITNRAMEGGDKLHAIWKNIRANIIMELEKILAQMIAVFTMKQILNLFPGFGSLLSGFNNSFLVPPTGSALMSPGANNPVVNNSFQAKFSTRDMGFIVHEGMRYNNNTRL